MLHRILCWLVLVLPPIGGFAQVFGTVDAVHGPVSVVSSDGTATAPTVGQKLLVGQTVLTQAGGELHAVTEDGGILALRPNSTFKMVQYQATQDNKSVIDMSLVRGALRSVTGWIGKLNPSGYRVSTATATIGIRGTDHEVSVLDAPDGRNLAGTYNSVSEGATVVRNAHGELHVQAGQHAFLARDAQTIASLLADRPDFVERRALRLEERLQERKERMGERVQQILEKHPDAVKNIRERIDGLNDEQRENVRKRLQRRAHRRNGD